MLGKDDTFTVIIALDLNVLQVENFVKVLKRIKRASGWTIANIIGISPSFCSHKIKLMLDHKTSIETQRRLNPPMQEVVNKDFF